MKTTKFFLTLFSALVGWQLAAQQPVQAFSATYIPLNTTVEGYEQTPAPASGSFAGCAGNNFRYSYRQGSRNALRLLSLTANGRDYFINSQQAIIRLRRVNNAAVTGNRHIVFLESVATPVGCPAIARFEFKSAYQDDIEAFLNDNYINQGTDNIFTNTANADGNNNNIERVDVLFPAGLSSASAQEAGFALFDRGVNNAHDGFRICAITRLDAAGNPASFGPVVSCVRGSGGANGSWGHPSMANGNTNLNVYVLRREAGESQLRSSAAINQQVGGVFFSFADLGVAANQTVYGYALLGPDGIANPASSQLLNLSDPAVYPPNTTEAVGGGLDLIAVNASFSTGGPTLPVQISFFSGSKENNRFRFSWKLENIPDAAVLDLEGSADGQRFETLYSWRHGAVKNAISFEWSGLPDLKNFRLRLAAGGRVYYSAIIRPGNGSGEPVRLYSNVVNSRQPVMITGLSDGNYSLQWTALNGRSWLQQLAVAGGSAMLRTPAALPSGMVVLRIFHPTAGLLKTEKLLFVP